MSNQTTLPIAIQLYTLRNLPQSLDEVLGLVASAGYPGVETVGDHKLPVSQMQDLLAKHNLKAVSTHVGLQGLESDLDNIIAFHQGIGNRAIVLPALPQDVRPADAAGWRAIGQRLDAIGATCAAAGMRFLYHNHAWEMTEYDGKPAIDWLLESAAPDHLHWEPDLAWIVRGNADPITMLKRHAGRCTRIHVKDLAAEGQGQDEMGFADVGSGTLDWSKLLPAAKAAGGEWFVVEHDLPKDAAKTARNSYAYLAQALAPLYR